MPNYQGVWSLSTQFQNASGWPSAPPSYAVFAGGFSNSGREKGDVSDFS